MSTNIIQHPNGQALTLEELLRQSFAAKGDKRVIVSDPSATYFGSAIDDRSLTPGAGARLGDTTPGSWLKSSVAAASSANPHRDVMALTHAHPAETIDPHALATQASRQRSCALFKSEDLQVMRLNLPRGKSIPPHPSRGTSRSAASRARSWSRRPMGARPCARGN